MTTILRESGAGVVRTRPREIPLAMIIHGFPFLFYMGMGLHLATRRSVITILQSWIVGLISLSTYKYDSDFGLLNYNKPTRGFVSCFVSFVCFFQDWLAFVRGGVQLTFQGKLQFENGGAPLEQDNFAFCKVKVFLL